MSLGRKIKKYKRKILLFLRKILPFKLYNRVILILSFKKFNKAFYSKKVILKKSLNLDNINNHEFKITSQNNEDGIIEFITDKIKIKNNIFFEIGCDFNEFNSLNLLRKGWRGTLVDYDRIKCDKLYANLIPRFKKSINIEYHFVNNKNINEVISKYLSIINFDFFSIDTDGMDYWIINDLKFKPKLVCLEFNPWLGKSEKLVIPLQEKFIYKSDMYFGASLGAYIYLMKKKGYKLVCIESSGNNAFFIRQEEFNFDFQEIDINKSFKYDPKFSENFYNKVYERLKKRDLIFL